MHSIIKMYTIFMNTENSKTSKPHVLIFELTDKLDLRIVKKSDALSILSNLLHMKSHKNLI